MTEKEFLGMLVVAIITLGSFIAIIVKFTQPINDLRLVIQKLNDRLDALQKDSDAYNGRVEKVEGRVDKLEDQFGKMETRMQIYHKDS